MAFIAPHVLGQTNSVSKLNAAPGNNRTQVPDQADQPALVGYSGPTGTDMTMVEDLATLTDTLAPGGWSTTSPTAPATSPTSCRSG